MEHGTSVDRNLQSFDTNIKDRSNLDTNNNHNGSSAKEYSHTMNIKDKVPNGNLHFTLGGDETDEDDEERFENGAIPQIAEGEGDDEEELLGNEDNDDDDDHHDDIIGDTDESDSEGAQKNIIDEEFSKETSSCSERNHDNIEANVQSNASPEQKPLPQSTGDFLSSLNSVVQRVSEEHRVKQELLQESIRKKENKKKDPPAAERPSQSIDEKELITLQPPDYPSLSEEQVSEKLVDQVVSSHSDVMTDIQKIDVDNLNMLHNLDKADPSVRRLFTRPKVTAQEMNQVKVDPDVKAVVDEFLRTNIVGNFIIARTLRENYATFFSWLAAHIQSERNAWAVRLKQALEKIEEQRRDSKDSSTLVIETAARLKLLVQSASENMFGMPGKQKRVIKVNNKAVSSLAGDGGENGKRPGSFYSSYFRKNERNENKVQAKKDEFQQKMDALGRMSDRMQQRGALTQSSLNVINVTSSNNGSKHVNADATSSNQKEASVIQNSDAGNAKGVNNSGSDKKGLKGGKKTTNGYYYNDEEYMTMYAGQDTEAEGLVVDYDEDTDWKQLLRDNIDVLTEVCESLINDRLACMRLIGVRNNQVANLEDALSTYIKERHSSGHHKRREIERRLGALERENKSLIDEMTALQRTLTEKNNDALNLQSQLEKLEKMISDSMTCKVNKCVGTEDLEYPKFTKPRKSPFVDEKFSKSPYNNTGPTKRDKKKKKGDDYSRSDNKGRLDATVTDYDLTDVSMKLEDETPSAKPIIETLAINSSNNSSRPVPLREPSLIEISEEKLRALKQRARKLEDSLHDAIHSMERMNRIPPADDVLSVTSGTSNSTAASMMGRPVKGYHPTNNKLWQKATFEVNGSKSSRTPHLAVTKSDRGCETERTDRHGAKLGLETEATSFLEGKSVKLNDTESEPPLTYRTVASQDMSLKTPIPSSLRVSTERLYVTPVSRNSHNGDCVSEDEFLNQSENEDDGHKQHQNNKLRSHSEAPSLMKKRKHRVISRFRGGGRGMAKCLRCQKLFSTVDNHKLACCYHLKDKERVEHYDQAGRLLRVMYAWKCCNQPQEAEGCFFGQHV